jgi:hypothetical protein
LEKMYQQPRAINLEHKAGSFKKVKHIKYVVLRVSIEVSEQSGGVIQGIHEERGGLHNLKK